MCVRESVSESVPYNAIYGHEAAGRGRSFTNHALSGRSKRARSSRHAIYGHEAAGRGRNFTNHAVCVSFRCYWETDGEKRKRAVVREVRTRLQKVNNEPDFFFLIISEQGFFFIYYLAS